MADLFGTTPFFRRINGRAGFLEHGKWMYFQQHFDCYLYRRSWENSHSSIGLSQDPTNVFFHLEWVNLAYTSNIISDTYVHSCISLRCYSSSQTAHGVGTKRPSGYLHWQGSAIYSSAIASKSGPVQLRSTSPWAKLIVMPGLRTVSISFMISFSIFQIYYQSVDFVCKPLAMYVCSDIRPRFNCDDHTPPQAPENITTEFSKQCPTVMCRFW